MKHVYVAKQVIRKRNVGIQLVFEIYYTGVTVMSSNICACREEDLCGQFFFFCMTAGWLVCKEGRGEGG